MRPETLVFAAVLALVVPGAHRLALVDDDRTDGNVPVIERLAGLRDRDMHPVSVH